MMGAIISALSICTERRVINVLKRVYDVSLPWGREYANNGLHKEQWLAYVLTGVRRKADNKPFSDGGDIGLIQVKSSRATICKGETLNAIYEHMSMDKAEVFAYVCDDVRTVYYMTPSEYIEFVLEFASVVADSSSHRKSSHGHGGSNGGGLKIKLKTCAESDKSHRMYKWFEGRL